MRHVNIFEKFNFDQFKVSIKSSNVLDTVNAYKIISKQIEQPLHLGITEAGGIRNGTVKSSIGISMLLSCGIGDTIRISLAANPTEEVKVGFDILRTLNIRYHGINFIACPTCSRQEFDVINVVKTLEKRLYDVSVPMNISIIGCVVNGHGEAIMSNIGIIGGHNKSSFYENGIRQKLFDNNSIVDQLEYHIRSKVAELNNKIHIKFIE